MTVDVRDQDAEKLFVMDELAFSVSDGLVANDIEDEVKELCRLLAIIHTKTNWVVTRDLLAEMNGSVQVYDEHTRRTL